MPKSKKRQKRQKLGFSPPQDDRINRSRRSFAYRRIPRVSHSSPNLALIGKRGSVQKPKKCQNLPKIVVFGHRKPAQRFSAHICCGQMTGWIGIALSTEVGLGPGDFVLDVDPAPPPQKRAELLPNFQLMSIVAKRLGGPIWHPALGMEVGLGPGHILLDGDPAPLLQKGDRAPPIFGPFLLWPNGWMHQDAIWYGSRPQPRRLCVRWGPGPLPQKGAEPPNFRPISIVAKQLDESRCHLVRR